MSYGYFGAVEAKWNLERLLQEYTINDLRKMSGICGIPEKSRKENLQSVNKYIIENKFDLYTTLNEVSKKALQETVHNFQESLIHLHMKCVR